MSPELWIECKVPCADCPEKIDWSAKKKCQHPWRQLIQSVLEESSNEIVPFDTPEQAVMLGATVSAHDVDGRRPSVQLTAEEPPVRHGYLKALVTEN